jgi:hypothetical protein
MTDHTVEGFDRGVSQRARGHLQLVHTEVDTVRGDGLLPCRDPAQVDSAGRMTTSPSTTSPFWPGDETSRAKRSSSDVS